MTAPEFSARIRAERIIAIVPRVRFGLPIAPIEVLIQEQVHAVAVPPDAIDELAPVKAAFRSRCEFGAYDVGTTDEVHAAADAGCTFVLLRRPDRWAIDTAIARGLAVVAPALTPTEVQAAWDLGVTAVSVVPADSFGGSYPEQLSQLCPDIPLLPRGNIGAYAAGRWLEHDAVGVCLDDALVGDAFSGGELDKLRERCQTFTQAVDLYR